MQRRYLSINTVVRKYQVETNRHDHLLDDETENHTPELVERFSRAVRRGFPEAKITWALSWQALTDKSLRYFHIRDAVRDIAAANGDDITFIPGGWFANVYNNRSQVDADIDDALAMIEHQFGCRPASLLAGFLSSVNIRHVRERHGIATVQGQIWSQYSIDNQDGDGSIAYPYYPSTQHFCKPAQGPADFIDAINLDGWTVDLVAGRYPGLTRAADGKLYNSRLGVGPIETLLEYGAETGMRQMKATTDAHFCDENVARNPFGWVTNCCELSVAHMLEERGLLDAFGDWIGWAKQTWPDLACPSIAGFGGDLRSVYRDNDGLTYILKQSGTGIGASFADQDVTWYMNKSFRLGLVQIGGETSVFDYTDYRDDYAEPDEEQNRNWSLLGRTNQKQQRPQDQPIRLNDWTSWQRIRNELIALYGNRLDELP